jgi:hypothetical protein
MKEIEPNLIYLIKLKLDRIEEEKLELQEIIHMLELSNQDLTEKCQSKNTCLLVLFLLRVVSQKKT